MTLTTSLSTERNLSVVIQMVTLSEFLNHLTFGLKELNTLFLMSVVDSRERGLFGVNLSISLYRYKIFLPIKMKIL